MNIDFNIKKFNSYSEMNRFVNNEQKKLRKVTQKKHNEFFDENKIKSRLDWIGASSYEELINGVKEYSYLKLLQETYEKIKSIIQKKGIKAKKIKIDYNSRGIGVFSFDRAMMSMYRKKVFYSEKHKKYFNSNEIEKKDKRYILKSDNSKIIEKEKIATHNKKVFAYKKQRLIQNNVIKLVSVIGVAGSISIQDAIYMGFPAIILAEMLEKAGYKIEILAFIGTNNQKQVGCCLEYPIKKQNEPLDKNLVSLVLSDPKYYRYNGFKQLESAYNFFKLNLPSAYGYVLNDEQIKQEYDDFIVGGANCTSEQKAINQIETVINKINSL